MTRYLKASLVIVLILSAVISPVGILVAHAGLLLDIIGFGAEGFAYAVAQIVNGLIFTPSAYLLRASAFVFDSVVPLSLGIPQGGTASIFQSGFIVKGWETLRDVTNILFIFALLYIAISTILQLGAGRNTKSLLINVITIALFVNFSLFVAQVVIDGTNLLAIELYNALSSSPHGLAAIILTGFNPQSLFSVASFEIWVSAYNQSYTVLVLLYLFGGVLNLVTAYVIFWAAFLFVGRIVILWFLLIFSSIAFAAYLLPNTQKYFHNWWSQLLSQAFIAPIFLFFFYILALFINPTDGVLKTLLSEAGNAALLGGNDLLSILLKVALGFSLVIVFMIIALKKTKALGGEAAAWATKAAGYTVGVAAAAAGGVVGAPVAGFAARFGGARLLGTIGAGTGGEAAGFARGAGRITGAPLRVPLYGAAKTAGEAAGKAAGAARAKAGEVAKKGVELGAGQTLGGTLLRGTGVARGLAGAEAGIRARVKTEIEKAEKDLGGWDENALRTEYGYATTTAEKRAAILKILGGKKKLRPQEPGEGPLTHDSIVRTLETLKARGYDTGKEIEDKYLWQYAETSDELKKAAKSLSPDALKEIGKVKRKGADGKELPSDFFDKKNPDGTDNTEVFDLAIKNMTSAHFKMLLDPEVRDDFSKNFVENLKEAMEREKKNIAEKLKKEGKVSEAASLESGASKVTIEEYFQSIQNLRGGAAIKDPSLRGFFANNGVPYKKKKKGGGGERDEESEEENE